jgi:hypothetical protein
MHGLMLIMIGQDCACAYTLSRAQEVMGGSPCSPNAMEAEVGLRVARGPDWQWGDQDGGEGCLGTITGVGGQGNAEGALPQVLWDYGYRSSNYRCGKEGKYDLVVCDSAPTGKPVFICCIVIKGGRNQFVPTQKRAKVKASPSL